jgi:sensor histidine kinase YesM
MHLKATETRFSFSVRNSVHPGREKKKNSGIGIGNARNRMELIYGNSYELSIDNKNKDIFEVRLNIPL